MILLTWNDVIAGQTWPLNSSVSQNCQTVAPITIQPIKHYKNLPMQYTEIFLALKTENFQLKNFDIFLIFAQNIDCGCSLERF